ncbi:uncharacterized protein F5Z01DRAFT_718418 [Emericellopsis atlantica]|uniref:DNA mismatch repair protein PMS1 n=1 Tax=Emericellopsis atlantica TaxID=2614577 RepID=A0A9P8CSU0_9HYPO|nr:uncharacterized protein F5Z01DRAFT_718418 [Emericellopsis atlantica]KAG9257550.1 hypothetical protein F5Z01DRAFT_718418 [Emericellopsis atlantica]
MATIKQIDGRTIHQIQSGQVIVDLCSVVKELVENSIDAGANNIDVRFKNQGLDLIEVQDNGGGIAPANYESVALKHHTSKLSTYADIGSLDTFGFRGEALASLCALSTMTVTTCLPEDAPKATKLSFEPSGKLKGTNVVAAQKGTTVSVEKLFHNLPVRRKELERNIKREWNKVIALLNQYACIQTNLKFSVSQQPTKGKRIVLFSTKGNATTKDNIINIFGAKTMTGLVPLDLTLEMQPSSVSSVLQPTVDTGSVSTQVRIVGHVSRPAQGEGRQTPDRQMFFINGRPCGLPQFAKTFNEVYKSYNSTQSPFIMADIQLDTHMYDVNVSPDKRTILLHEQNQLLDSLRSALNDLFDSQDYSVPTSQLARTKQSPFGQRDSATPARTQTWRGQDVTPAPAPAPVDSDSDSESAEAPRSSASRAHLLRSSHSRTPSVKASANRADNLIDRWIQRRDTTEDSDGARTQDATPPLPDRQEPVSTSTKEIDVEERSVSDEEDVPEDEDATMAETEPRNPHVHQYSNEPELFVPEAPVPPDVGPPQMPIPKVQHVRQEIPKSSPLAHRSPSKPASEPISITIGDPEVPSSSHKRRRVLYDAHVDGTEDIEEGSSSDEELPTKPSFGGILSQKFTAGLRGRSEDSGVNDRQATVTVQLPIDAPDPKAAEEDKENVRTTHRQASSQAESSVASVSSHHSDDRPEEDSVIEAGEQNHATSTRAADAEDGEDAAAFAKTRGNSLQASSRRKDATLQTIQNITTGERAIQSMMTTWTTSLRHTTSSQAASTNEMEDITSADAESKLSLIIQKSDFGAMRIIGQFNMGFIIAIRPGDPQSNQPSADELFIIDQHASDEKYNFERLQDITIVQSQRLVHPKRLELTALEEEIVMQNPEAIEANGFKVSIDTSGDTPVGSRCQLMALPLSRETTFNVSDLEELIALLGEESSESKHIPRPAKVRKMFAMRACRSSIMIGKALTRSQMSNVVGHMGELDKPWNCPHGRPTMRHLCRMQMWDEKSWDHDAQACSSLASWAAA